MGVSKISASANRKKSLVVGLLVLAGLLTFGAVYYLQTVNNTSSENASAGKVKTMTLRGFTLQLVEVQPGIFGRSAKQKIQWKYTITGAPSLCYKDVSVTTNADEAKDETEIADPNIKEDTNKNGIVLLLNVANSTKCADDPKPGAGVSATITKTGSFLADDKSPFRFVVSYNDATTITNAKKVLEEKNLANRYQATYDAKNTGFLLKSKYITTSKTKGWEYTMTGTEQNCYAHSSFVGKDTSGNFNGKYTLRFVKNDEKFSTCAATDVPVNISNKTLLSPAATFINRFAVRYVQLGTLNSAEPMIKQLSSNGLTMKYYYYGSNTWKYEIKGTSTAEIRTCFLPVVSVTPVNKDAKDITVALSFKSVQTVKACDNNSKAKIISTSGTFQGREDAVIKFTAPSGLSR